MKKEVKNYIQPKTINKIPPTRKEHPINEKKVGNTQYEPDLAKKEIIKTSVYKKGEKGEKVEKNDKITKIKISQSGIQKRKSPQKNTSKNPDLIN